MQPICLNLISDGYFHQKLSKYSFGLKAGFTSKKGHLKIYGVTNFIVIKEVW